MTAVPTLCASVVQALVSMISPLRYSLDYRPFFTIHDSDFKEFTTKTQSPYVFALLSSYIWYSIDTFKHLIQELLLHLNYKLYSLLTLCTENHKPPLLLALECVLVDQALFNLHHSFYELKWLLSCYFHTLASFSPSP